MLIGAMLLLRRRLWRPCLPYLPVALVLLVCLASPVNDNLRYAMPYVVTAPLLLVYSLAQLASRTAPIPRNAIPERDTRTPPWAACTVPLLREAR
ncbi:MAG: DUF6020 family protein [Bifidobacteriaceae bacterium]|nr:DUF6020 family protein [Bifidobacteriaceae bacterium]